MISLLLAADALAKLGATVGGGLAVIGAGIGIGRIGGQAMDAMARALESAAALLEESPICKMVADRYASFDGGLGKKFENGELTLEEVYSYGKEVGEPKQTSGKQELYEAILNMYC